MKIIDFRRKEYIGKFLLNLLSSIIKKNLSKNCFLLCLVTMLFLNNQFVVRQVHADFFSYEIRVSDKKMLHF